jgi:hypothetical protein
LSPLHFFHFYRISRPGNEYNICCGRIKYGIVSTTLHGREELSVIDYI